MRKIFAKYTWHILSSIIMVSFLFSQSVFSAPSVQTATVISQEVRTGILDPLLPANTEDPSWFLSSELTASQAIDMVVTGPDGLAIHVITSTTTFNIPVRISVALYRAMSAPSLFLQNIKPVGLEPVTGPIVVEALNSTGALVTQLDGPLTLKVIMNEAIVAGFVPDTMALYTYSTSTSQWVLVPAFTYNQTTKTLTATLSHLSIYAVFAKKVTVTAETGGSTGGSYPAPAPTAQEEVITEKAKPSLTQKIKEIISSIFPSKEEKQEEPIPSSSTRPSKLFDIRATMSSGTYTRNDTPLFNVTFESFGTVPTLVLLHITLRDEWGNIIEQLSDRVVIETTGVYRKKFSGLDGGRYTVTVDTEYDDAVKDSFHATFTVEDEEELRTTPDIPPRWILLSFIVLALTAYALFLRTRSKK